MLWQVMLVAVVLATSTMNCTAIIATARSFIDAIGRPMDLLAATAGRGNRLCSSTQTMLRSGRYGANISV